MRSGPLRRTCALVLAGALVACTSSDEGTGDPSVAATAAPGEEGPEDDGPTEDAATSPVVPDTPEPTASPVDPEEAGPDDPGVDRPTDEELLALGVDELGRVPILAWHYVTDDEDGLYRTSRDSLRAQLQDLYDRGYRPVTQVEYASGTFPIPLGTSPVVLTFDDSTRGQFGLTDDGEVDPDTAVGVIEAFADEHPDWRATAVFSVTFPQPFGDSGFAPKLQWLHDNGYEFANHSWGHTSLARMSPSQVAENLARNAAALRDAVPSARFDALTLPFGSRSPERTTERSGTANGVSYEHDLVYLFGAYPYRSPHDVQFDPLLVQRVPATEVESEGVEWLTARLDDLEADGSRLVSDGDPQVVTVPESRAGEVRELAPSIPLRTYGPGVED